MPTLTPDQRDFRDYLLVELPAVLSEVAEAVPKDRRLRPLADGGIAIHVRQLGISNQAIRRMDATEVDLFAVGLHWLQALDLGVWRWSDQHYRRFREFTRFPKVLDDRPGRPLAALGPPSTLRHTGGRSGDFLHHRMVRYGMVRGLVPAVVDIVERLAGMQEVPWLIHVMERVLVRQGIATPTVRPACRDPLTRDAIDTWLMPLAPWSDDSADLFAPPPVEIRGRERRPRRKDE